MIEIEILDDDNLCLRPVGELDWLGAMSVRHALHDTLTPEPRVVIDLSRVNRIDPVGMSALVGSVRWIRALGGEIKVSNPRVSVSRRLQLAGVYNLLLRPAGTGGGNAA